MVELGPFTFTNGGFIAFVSITLTGIAVAAFAAADYFRGPIVCVCEVNGLVGVVLRRDYEKGSRRFWGNNRHMMKGTFLNRRGHIIAVYPTFKFNTTKGEDNPKLGALLKDCRVERACFEVMSLYGGAAADPLEEAWRHIHGRFWRCPVVD